MVILTILFLCDIMCIVDPCTYSGQYLPEEISDVTSGECVSNRQCDRLQLPCSRSIGDGAQRHHYGVLGALPRQTRPEFLYYAL
jgi:hypothetical protein